MTSKKAQIEAELRSQYGALLTLSDLAVVLRYPSVAAVRKARQRGHLPLPVSRMPPRRGWYATPSAVAELLARIDGP